MRNRPAHLPVCHTSSRFSFTKTSWHRPSAWYYNGWSSTGAHRPGTPPHGSVPTQSHRFIDEIHGGQLIGGYTVQDCAYFHQPLLSRYNTHVTTHLTGEYRAHYCLDRASLYYSEVKLWAIIWFRMLKWFNDLQSASWKTHSLLVILNMEKAMDAMIMMEISECKSVCRLSDFSRNWTLV